MEQDQKGIVVQLFLNFIEGTQFPKPTPKFKRFKI